MTDVPVETPSSSVEPHRLQRGVLTVPNAIALAAAAMAPVLAVVLNAPAAVPAAGAAMPLSFLLAFVACLLVGNTVVQFARQLPTAGSFYTFNSRGLGPAAGFFTGWLFWIGYAMLAPGPVQRIRLRFVTTTSSRHSTSTCRGGSSASPRWPSSLAFRSAASRRRSDLDLTLLVIEVIIFLILGVARDRDGGQRQHDRRLPRASVTEGVRGRRPRRGVRPPVVHRIRRRGDPRRGDPQPEAQHSRLPSLAHSAPSGCSTCS